MEKYLHLIQKSVDIVNALVNFFSLFSEFTVIYLWYMCQLDNFGVFLAGAPAFNWIMKALIQTQPQSQNFLFAFCGLINKVVRTITSFSTFMK